MRFKDILEMVVEGDLHNLTHEVLTRHGMTAGSGLDPDAPKNKYLKYGGVADEAGLHSDLTSLGWTPREHPDPDTTAYEHPRDARTLHVTHWTAPFGPPGDIRQKISHAVISGDNHRRLN